MKSPLSGLFLAAILFLPAITNGQTSIIEQARKEAEVVLYSTITVGAFNELNRAFKEKYPFLNVQHIRLGPAQQLARIMQEQRAGHFVADVVYNNLLHLIYLKENGILGKYESPENKFLMKEAIDSDGFWVGGDIDVLVTGFNTNMISRKDVPTTYEDFWTASSRGKWPSTATTPTRLSGW
jgi:iron(III) transport system substrate-binding protein